MYRSLKYRYRYDNSASSAAANNILASSWYSISSAWRHIRFKRRYNKFAPAIEIDQMVSNNSNYVTLNTFMLFITWGLRKNLNKAPAGNP
jgi:hypothetical protein